MFKLADMKRIVLEKTARLGRAAQSGVKVFTGKATLEMVQENMLEMQRLNSAMVDRICHMESRLEEFQSREESRSVRVRVLTWVAVAEGFLIAALGLALKGGVR